MKRIFLLLIIVCQLKFSQAQTNLVFEPARPQPGSSITIMYQPRSTELMGIADFEAIAYLMEGKLPLAKLVPLRKEGDIYTGMFSTNDTTKAVFVTFTNDKIRENNKDQGYYTLLYDKDGKELTGSNLALSQGFGSYGGIWGLKI